MRLTSILALACAVYVGPPLPVAPHPPDADVIPLHFAPANEIAPMMLLSFEPPPVGPAPGYCALMLPGSTWPQRRHPVIHVLSDARTNSLIVWGDADARVEVRRMIAQMEERQRWVMPLIEPPAGAAFRSPGAAAP